MAQALRKPIEDERAPDPALDIHWLQEHGREYPGQWVALCGGDLLAHAASLQDVLSTVKKNEWRKPTLVHYIDHPQEVPGLTEAKTYAEKIRLLVEADRVGGARALLAEALEKGDHGEDLSRWQSVLAPARMIRVGGERDIDRTADFKWLEEHAKDYQHEWVAVLQGELIAHSASLDEVRATVRQRNLRHRPLLHYIDIPPEPAGLAGARTYGEKIRILVEADWVGAARKLLAEALERGDHDEDLSGWQRVLAPAKVIRRSSPS